MNQVQAEYCRIFKALKCHQSVNILLLKVWKVILMYVMILGIIIYSPCSSQVLLIVIIRTLQRVCNH